jgi:glycine reductase
VISGSSAQQSGIIDMWGPGAQISPLSSKINIVVVSTLIEGVTELEAHDSIRSAEFKIAHRLAEATRHIQPEDVEVFELSPLDDSLPRVVYILACLTEWHAPLSGVHYYGLPIRESLPTFLHPNELFDGAITTNVHQGGGNRETNWAWMTHPVVLDLMRRHGKELNFLGVILQRTRFEAQHGKQVTAACTSQMAKLLGADGAIITRINTSGSNFMDLMLTVQACERKGVKTVFLTPEWGGKEGTDLPLVFYVPEASTLISTGSFERDIKVPAPEKVIGASKGEVVQLFADPPIDPWEEITFPGWFCFTGGVDWLGHQDLTCMQY